MCCEGKEIPWKEIISPEQKALRGALFPGIMGGLAQGPQTPQFPINAPWDPNFAAGTNMFRAMGGMSPDYQPQQMPMMFNPEWQPQWPQFGPYMVDAHGNKREDLVDDPTDFEHDTTKEKPRTTIPKHNKRKVT